MTGPAGDGNAAGGGTPGRWRWPAVAVGVAVSAVTLWLAGRGTDWTAVGEALAAADLRTLPAILGLLALCLLDVVTAG